MQDFPELMAVEQLARTPELMLRTEIIAEISSGNRTFPIIAMTIGSQDRNAPCFGLFGGVHGLERVGSQVVISYLDSLLNQLTWDRNLRQVLERTRVLAIPIINPAGMYAFTRCNPNGVGKKRENTMNLIFQNTYLGSVGMKGCRWKLNHGHSSTLLEKTFFPLHHR